VDRLLLTAASLFFLIIVVVAAFAIEQSPLPVDTKTLVYYYLIGITLFLMFVMNAGYFILFEGLWRGQTPGKRLAQIRVIEANGQPVGWSSVFIRNLLRVVDEMPGVFLGILPMIFDRNERRFGDFAAGTLVIRERLQSLSTADLRIAAEPPVASPDGTHPALIDAGQITPDEYGVLVSYLKRRDSLTRVQRESLAKSMAARFREKLGLFDEADSPERFLERVYIAYSKKAEPEL
jgi:uncharacterized RDD family membrane protein YckC